MKPKRHVARDVQEARVLLKAFLDSPPGSPDTLAISLRTDAAEELIAEIGELGELEAAEGDHLAAKDPAPGGASPKPRARYHEQHKLSPKPFVQPFVRCPHCDEIFHASELSSQTVDRTEWGVAVFACPSCDANIKIEPAEYLDVAKRLRSGEPPDRLDAFREDELTPSEKEAQSGAPTVVQGFYLLDEPDSGVVGAALELLWKMVRSPAITASQVEATARAIRALDGLPAVGTDLDITVQLSGPRRRFGEHEIWHWWEVHIDGQTIVISSGGYFHRPGTGGDSFTGMHWTAVPGAAAQLNDYLHTLSVIDDAMAFEQEVAEIDLLEQRGYRIRVYVEGEEVG